MAPVRGKTHGAVRGGSPSARRFLRAAAGDGWRPVIGSTIMGASSAATTPSSGLPSSDAFGGGEDVGEAVGHVTVGDGTRIGFRSRGEGPGLVIVHGAMESSADYEDLAEELAHECAVHVVDRRGRGLSGPYGTRSGLAAEVDDVRAILEATGSRRLYGVSSGGVIVLQAALDLPALVEVAAYEPALSVPGLDSAKSHAFVDRYEAAMARGQTAEALLAVLKGAQIGPRWLRLLPVRLAAPLVRRLLEDQDGDDQVAFGSLVPTLHHDFVVSDQGSADLQRFTALQPEVLLLGGSRSPRYLKAALTTLESLLPHARRVQQSGVGHNASNNRRQGGRPDLVARELLAFFTMAEENREDRTA